MGQIPLPQPIDVQRHSARCFPVLKQKRLPHFAAPHLHVCRAFPVTVQILLPHLVSPHPHCVRSFLVARQRARLRFTLRVALILICPSPVQAAETHFRPALSPSLTPHSSAKLRFIRLDRWSLLTCTQSTVPNCDMRGSKEKLMGLCCLKN